MSEKLPMRIDTLIPHGPGIWVVDELTHVGEEGSTACFTVPANSPWLDKKRRLDDTAYIEMIAQSFAAKHAFGELPDKKSERGLLLGVKDLKVTGEAHAGDRLQIELRKVIQFGDFGIVEGTVRNQNGRTIAHGELKVWRPSGTDKMLIK